MKRYLFLLLLLLLVGMSLFLFGKLVYIDILPHPYYKAQSQMSKFDAALYVYLIDNKMPDSWNTNNLAVYLPKLLIEKRYLIWDKEYLNNKNEILDPWKNRYNIEPITNFTVISKMDIRIITNSIIMWSSGANGSNEFGKGDDFYFGDSYKELRWRFLKRLLFLTE